MNKKLLLFYLIININIFSSNNFGESNLNDIIELIESLNNNTIDLIEIRDSRTDNHQDNKNYLPIDFFLKALKLYIDKKANANKKLLEKIRNNFISEIELYNREEVFLILKSLKEKENKKHFSFLRINCSVKEYDSYIKAMGENYLKNRESIINNEELFKKEINKLIELYNHIKNNVLLNEEERENLIYINIDNYFLRPIYEDINSIFLKKNIVFFNYIIIFFDVIKCFHSIRICDILNFLYDQIENEYYDFCYDNIERYEMFFNFIMDSSFKHEELINFRKYSPNWIIKLKALNNITLKKKHYIVFNQIKSYSMGKNKNTKLEKMNSIFNIRLKKNYEIAFNQIKLLSSKTVIDLRLKKINNYINTKKTEVNSMNGINEMDFIKFTSCNNVK